LFQDINIKSRWLPRESLKQESVVKSRIGADGRFVTFSTSTKLGVATSNACGALCPGGGLVDQSVLSTQEFNALTADAFHWFKYDRDKTVLPGLSTGMSFLWESHGKRPMSWDRHKLLWDGNGTDKYIPWTTLCIARECHRGFFCTSCSLQYFPVDIFSAEHLATFS